MQKVIFQKAISQKTVRTIGLILLLTGVFWFLSKMGIQPIWAAIGFFFIKGIIRFIFKIAVMLVSVAIVIALFILLIGMW